MLLFIFHFFKNWTTKYISLFAFHFHELIKKQITLRDQNFMVIFTTRYAKASS